MCIPREYNIPQLYFLTCNYCSYWKVNSCMCIIHSGKPICGSPWILFLSHLANKECAFLPFYLLQPCHRSCQVSNCLSRIQWTLSHQNCKAAKTDETQFNNCIALWRLGARSHYFLSCSSAIKRTTPSVVSCRCKLLNAPKNNNNYLNKPDLQATAANSIHNRCIVDYFVGYILLTCS